MGSIHAMYSYNCALAAINRLRRLRAPAIKVATNTASQCKTLTP
jgi:hypothetical protein